MTTIFHAGRKILREAIGDHHLAEIADFLYFRVSGSKYNDDKGEFCLIKNISSIAKELGFSEYFCYKAINELNGKFITKVKHKCYDGAVRLKIYVSEKLKTIMKSIENLCASSSSQKSQKSHNIPPNSSDSIETSADEISEISSAEVSYIKEQTKKEQKNNNVKPLDTTTSLDEENLYAYDPSLDIIPVEKKSLSNEDIINIIDVIQPTFESLQLDLANQHISISDEQLSFAKQYIAKKSNLSIQNQEETFDLNGLEKIAEKSKNSIQNAESYRHANLTERQAIALLSIILEAEKKWKTTFGKKELFSWMKHQVTSVDTDFKGLFCFQKVAFAIRKILICDPKKYCKPLSFTCKKHSIHRI